MASTPFVGACRTAKVLPVTTALAVVQLEVADTADAVELLPSAMEFARLETAFAPKAIAAFAVALVCPVVLYASVVLVAPMAIDCSDAASAELPMATLFTPWAHETLPCAIA